MMILLLVLSPGTECTLCAAVLTTLCLIATLWWEGVGLPGAVSSGVPWDPVTSDRGCSDPSHSERIGVGGREQPPGNCFLKRELFYNEITYQNFRASLKLPIV